MSAGIQSIQIQASPLPLVATTMDKARTKKKALQKITAEIIEKIKAVAPQIQSGELSLADGAVKCGISMWRLGTKLDALNEGRDLIKMKERQKITAEIIEKIKAVAPKIQGGELTIEQAAKECGISYGLFNKKLKALENGNDITKRKAHQEITEEIIEKIKAVAPKIQGGELTIEQAAKECRISDKTLRKKLKALENGNDLTKRKAPQKITAEMIEKIKAVAPKIQGGELTIEQAAKECDISCDLLNDKLKALKNGNDLTQKKAYQKTTPEIIEKIKAVAPKIQSGELTLQQAAKECGISSGALHNKLKALKNGNDLIKRKSPQQITAAIVEKIKAVAPKIQSGVLTIEQAAKECAISVGTLRIKLKALEEGKAIITKNSSHKSAVGTFKELPVPMTPVKEQDAVLLASLSTGTVGSEGLVR